MSKDFKDYWDWYDILGVNQDATTPEIKQAYREKAAQYHPDVSNDPNAEEKFKIIKKSKDVLTNPLRRKKYDREQLRRRHYRDQKQGKSLDTNSRGSNTHTPKKKSNIVIIGFLLMLLVVAVVSAPMLPPELQYIPSISMDSPNLDLLEQKIFEYTNAERESRGIEPLAWDDERNSFSRSHSRDMVMNDYFGTTNLQGYSPSMRVSRNHDISKVAISIGANKWLLTGISENIVAGPHRLSTDATARFFVDTWVRNENDAANMFDVYYLHHTLAIGCAFDTTKLLPTYICTQDLYRKQGNPAPHPIYKLEPVSDPTSKSNSEDRPEPTPVVAPEPTPTYESEHRNLFPEGTLPKAESNCKSTLSSYDCDLFLDALEIEIFRLTNYEREQNGLRPVKWDVEMAIIARDHSSDMMINNYFSHQNPRGENSKARSIRYGYDSDCCYSENIAKMPWGNVVGMGYVQNEPSVIADATVDGFMGSPGHRETMLMRNQMRLGVGCAFDGTHYYCTENFYY